MYQRNARGWIKHLDFIIVDAILLHLIMVGIYGIRYSDWLYKDPAYRRLAVLTLASEFIIFLMFESMHNVMKRGLYSEFIETVRHCLEVFILVMAVLYFTKSTVLYSNTVMIATTVAHIFVGFCSRVYWKWFVAHYRITIGQRKQMLALLDPETAEKSMAMINHRPAENYEIVGIILNGVSDRTVIDGVPVVADVEDAAAFIRQNSVDSIYIDCSITDPKVVKLMDACKQMAIPLHYRVPELFGEGVHFFVERIGGKTVLTSSLNYATMREQITKRIVDILGGTVGSIIALLIMLVLGPFIKKASPGPILFAQERVGLNGRHFKMYKLRSMYLDADEKKQELMKQHQEADSRMFKLENDPRIIGNKILPDGTVKKGIGDFIRRTSLDEFPQFFNVLMGQMSLVGTRPPTVDEWEKYEYHHRARLACKPGITGLWQVSGRSQITDFEEVVKLDTQYIMNWSFGLDIKIILKTIAVVFTRKGAM